MSQFLGILVFVLIWIVPAILRANAKKKKAAQLEATKRRMNSQTSQSNPVTQQQTRQSNSQEVEKMLEKLLGVDITTSEGSTSYEETPVHDKEEYESVEYEEVNSHFNVDLDTNYSLAKAEKLSFEELIAMGESDAGLFLENIDESEIDFHPAISDFDLRKAVIYSEILAPRYF